MPQVPHKIPVIGGNVRHLTARDHDKAVTIKLRLPASARRAARAALRRHKHVIARVQIRATSQLRGAGRPKTTGLRRISLIP